MSSKQTTWASPSLRSWAYPLIPTTTTNVAFYIRTMAWPPASVSVPAFQAKMHVSSSRAQPSSTPVGAGVSVEALDFTSTLEGWCQTPTVRCWSTPAARLSPSVQASTLPSSSSPPPTTTCSGQETLRVLLLHSLTATRLSTVMVIPHRWPLPTHPHPLMLR